MAVRTFTTQHLKYRRAPQAYVELQGDEGVLSLFMQWDVAMKKQVMLLIALVALMTVIALPFVISAVRGLSAKLPSLHQAARDGDKSDVQKLLESGSDPNELSSSRFPPIWYALTSGHDDIAEVLVKAGAKINVPVGSGGTMMFYADAASKSEHLDIEERQRYLHALEWLKLHTQ